MSGSEPGGQPQAQAVPGRTRLVLAALVLLLVAAVVALVLALRDLDHERGLREAGEQAEKAARAAVVATTTYDHRTVEDDFAWVDSAGTEEFQEEFAEISAPIKELVVELRASAVGRVVDSAVTVHDSRHVTVLVFVDQTVTVPGDKAPTLSQPRVTVTMVRQDGRWLVDDEELGNLVP